MSALAGLDGRTRRRADNAARLFEAAWALFAERPYDEVSVDDVCAAAGVGRATFFRIYETKAGVLQELNRRLAARARDLVEAGPDDLRSRLDAVRRAVAETWQGATPGQLGLAADVVARTPVAGAHTPHPELLALTVEVVAAGRAAGEVAGDVPDAVLASLALTSLCAAVVHAIDDPATDVDRLSRRLLDAWLGGVGQRAAR